MLEDVVLIRRKTTSVELNIFSIVNSEVADEKSKSYRRKRYCSAILRDPRDPFYPLLKEFLNVVSEDLPSVLPSDRGVRHESDLELGIQSIVQPAN